MVKPCRLSAWTFPNISTSWQLTIKAAELEKWNQDQIQNQNRKHEAKHGGHEHVPHWQVSQCHLISPGTPHLTHWHLISPGTGRLERFFTWWGRQVAVHPYLGILACIGLTLLSSLGFLAFRYKSRFDKYQLHQIQKWGYCRTEHRANFLWIPPDSDYNIKEVKNVRKIITWFTKGVAWRQLYNFNERSAHIVQVNLFQPFLDF